MCLQIKALIHLDAESCCWVISFSDSEQVLDPAVSGKRSHTQLHTWCRQSKQALYFLICSQKNSLSCVFLEQLHVASHWTRLSVLRIRQEHKIAQQNTVYSCVVDK